MNQNLDNDYIEDILINFNNPNIDEIIKKFQKHKS